MIKITHHQEHILNQALEKFGLQAQLLKTIEELTELSLELQHGISRGFEESINIESECADVIICLHYLLASFNQKLIQKEIDFKIHRLSQRLNNL